MTDDLDQMRNHMLTAIDAAILEQRFDQRHEARERTRHTLDDLEVCGSDTIGLPAQSLYLQRQRTERGPQLVRQ